ncbi:MAG TPA: serine hydrolase domain-containing protein [Terriglobales bacterium]|nr:serine hydrolase domain-containing protein [Terriglobales bacterium]
MRAFPFALIAGMLVLSQISMSQDATPQSYAPVKQIDAVFAGLQSDRAPGAAVLVIHDGKVVFERGYGITDLRTLHKIDEHTNFRLASLTKQFTAIALMLLVNDSKVRYEEKLTDIFPDFPEYGKQITMRELLNHTSGLLDYEDLMRMPDKNTPENAIPQIKDREVLQLLKQQNHTKFESGTKWDYSNSGYVVLAQVVEKVSGQPFGDFLRERIFAPLGMSNTVAYQKGKNEVQHRAYGHSKEGDRWKETDQSPTSATLGDGGIYTSLEDMVRWNGALDHHTLLSEDAMQPALTPARWDGEMVRDRRDKPIAYGFGWFLAPYRGHSRMFHYGETAGFRNNIQRFPADRLTVLVLCNRADLQPEGLALRVADLFLPAN